MDLGGTVWIWVELGGTRRRSGESGRNWVDLGGTWWIWEELSGIGLELGGIWVELSETG